MPPAHRDCPHCCSAIGRRYVPLSGPLPCFAGISIRESAVLGLVGAGDVGLDTALNLLYWDQLAVVLLGIFIVVMAEIIVTAVRARIL
jgi:hypothetical protein